MTTRAIVPNGDGEGSLGTSTAKWGAVYSSDPASGENSGQVPTTAWVQKLLADALAKQKTAYEQAISTAVSDAHSYIRRNTKYAVGDVLTSPSLPPGCVIVVTQAGTTGSTEPDWTTIKSNMGGVITDNTVTFYINDTLSKHSIGDIVYKPLTKVTEHEYLLPLDGQTIDGVTYKRLVDYLGTNVLPNLNGRYLRADTTPGTMVEAGLPNITGEFGTDVYGFGAVAIRLATGAFYGGGNRDVTRRASYSDKDATKDDFLFLFDASRSSAIYGKSDTVTPLTYTVRAYIAYA